MKRNWGRIIGLALVIIGVFLIDSHNSFYELPGIIVALFGLAIIIKAEKKKNFERNGSSDF